MVFSLLSKDGSEAMYIVIFKQDLFLDELYCSLRQGFGGPAPPIPHTLFLKRCLVLPVSSGPWRRLGTADILHVDLGIDLLWPGRCATAFLLQDSGDLRGLKDMVALAMSSSLSYPARPPKKRVKPTASPSCSGPPAL